MNASFAATPADLSAIDGVVVVIAFEEGAQPAVFDAADALTGGALTRAMQKGRFKAKHGETLEIPFPAGAAAERLIAIGAGKRAELTAAAARTLGGKLFAALGKCAAVAVALGDLPADLAAEMALGADLRAYRFDMYRARKDDEDGAPALTFGLDDHDDASAAYGALTALRDGVALARNLVNEPGNVLTPPAFKDRLAALAAEGLEIDILDRDRMADLGMGALLGVAQGSVQPPYIVVMRWNGGGDEKPLALVGKAVTFDTGGISIKPAGGMEEMTMDMGGAAAVSGTMLTLARRKAKANVVGVVGLVENMPDGNAQRPGDIVRSAAGKTIEIINTDAEGRLVLCDALWYAQKTFDPRAVIDLATLTGAILVALGHEFAGLFSTSDDLSAQIAAAGAAVGEPVWRMPLAQAFDDSLKSHLADMKNTGALFGGSSSATHFLGRSIDEGRAWAHLDIAGVAHAKENKPTCPRGGAGWGVMLLNQLVADHYEA